MNLDYVSSVVSEKFQRILRPGPLRSPSRINCAPQLKHEVLGELPEITSRRGLTMYPRPQFKCSLLGWCYQCSPKILLQKKNSKEFYHSWDHLTLSFQLQPFRFGHQSFSAPKTVRILIIIWAFTCVCACVCLCLCVCACVCVWMCEWIMLSLNRLEALGAWSNIFLH